MYLTTFTIHVVEYFFDSVDRGHHIYKSTWTPFNGEVLSVHPEDGNPHYTYAVGVLKDGVSTRYYFTIESGCGFLPAPNKRHLRARRKPVLNKIAAPVSERRLTTREYGIDN